MQASAIGREKWSRIAAWIGTSHKTIQESAGRAFGGRKFFCSASQCRCLEGRCQRLVSRFGSLGAWLSTLSFSRVAADEGRPAKAGGEDGHAPKSRKRRLHRTAGQLS